MKPLLKYRGGKSRELPHILPLIPPFGGRYIEPFFGGGAVYFALEPREAIINDINPRLMAFYRAVSEDFGTLRRDLDRLEEIYTANRLSFDRRKAAVPSTRVADDNEELYYLLRDAFNGLGECDYSEAAVYYFINKTAYSGMIRYLDGGDILPQLKFDDFGAPMTTAPSNTADIIADYGDFGVAVEVTMTNRQRQFEAEGESVFRHTGRLVDKYKKPFYCLLIAPKINPSVVAFFYGMHRTNISYYGGVPKAVPLSLVYFRKMLSNARRASYRPDKEHIFQFFENAHRLALTSYDENDWMEKVNAMAADWTL